MDSHWPLYTHSCHYSWNIFRQTPKIVFLCSPLLPLAKSFPLQWWLAPAEVWGAGGILTSRLAASRRYNDAACRVYRLHAHAKTICIICTCICLCGKVFCVRTADLTGFDSCGGGWDSDKYSGCRTLIITLFISLVSDAHSAETGAGLWICGWDLYDGYWVPKLRIGPKKRRLPNFMLYILFLDEKRQMIQAGNCNNH